MYRAYFVLHVRGCVVAKLSAAIEFSLKLCSAEVKRSMYFRQSISNRIFFMLLTASLMVLVTGFQKDSLVVHCRWYRLKVLKLACHDLGKGKSLPCSASS